MRKSLTLACALALAACMNSTQGTTTQAVEYTCASATAALKTVILLNDKLSAPTRANVSRAVQVVDPVCSQETVPTLNSTAFAALSGAMTQLTAAAVEATQ